MKEYLLMLANVKDTDHPALRRMQDHIYYYVVDFKNSKVATYSAFKKSPSISKVSDVLDGFYYEPSEELKHMLKGCTCPKVRNEWETRFKEFISTRCIPRPKKELEIEFIEADSPEELDAILKSRAIIGLD